MKRKYILPVIMFIAAFSSCNKVDYSDPATGEGLTFVADIKSTKATASTDAVAGAFEAGDSIALYLKSSKNGYRADNSNVLYINNGSVFATASGTKALYYYSYDNHDFYGYYPYHSLAPTHSDASKVLKFNVYENQNGSSTATPALSNYTLSDLMWTSKKSQKPQQTGASAIQLQFDHKLSNIIVSLTNRGGATFIGVNPPEVYVSNTNRAALLNLESGVATSNTTDKVIGNVKMVPIEYYEGADKKTAYNDGVTTKIVYRAIAVPQVIPTTTAFIRVDANGVVYHVVSKNEMTFLSGSQHRFAIENTGVGLRLAGGTIQNWGATQDVNGGDLGGDGVVPCKLNFKINSGDATKVESAVLKINGVDYTATGVEYNSSTQTLSVSYDQGSNWGQTLQQITLKDADGNGVNISTTNPAMPQNILGDNTNLNYATVITTLGL